MWELGYKESWVPKNWSFWIVVLEKTLESPLDCKIKPVNLKGNQCWIFIGRTDAEAEAPVIWSPDEKNWRTFHWKRPWCWERLKAGGEGDDRGWDGWMASLTQWTWVWPNSRRQWRTGKPGVLQFIGSQTVGHNWATEQQDACKGMSESLHCSPESITILLIGYTSKEDVRWKWKWSCSVMSDSLRPHGL